MNLQKGGSLGGPGGAFDQALAPDNGLYGLREGKKK